MLAFAATVALAYFSRRLRRNSRDPVTMAIKPVAPVETTNLPIENDDPDFRECSALSQHIADLMTDNEWLEISNKISAWEARLASSPGGTRYHEIAVRTCLSGLHGLIDDAPRTALSDLDAAGVEVSHFEDTHRQSPDNHILALLAARAHIALGEACAADDWPESERKAAWRQMAQHFIAAGEILEPFDAVAHMSPLLAEAHYLCALGAPGGDSRLWPLFEDWIDLDPSNSGIYDAHVAALVAHDMLTGDEVLHEADAALKRTEDTLGFGGYALFFMPLLVEYDSARDLVDPELFAAALMDLASMSATQAEVNHAAATLLTEMETDDEAVASVYRDTLILMIRRHLKVIYPRVWPISVEEIQALVAEAALIVPEIDSDEASTFLPTRHGRLAA